MEITSGMSKVEFEDMVMDRLDNSLLGGGVFVYLDEYGRGHLMIARRDGGLRWDVTWMRTSNFYIVVNKQLRYAGITVMRNKV